jgi:exodeoxyribonuclease VII small subunit
LENWKIGNFETLVKIKRISSMSKTKSQIPESQTYQAMLSDLDEIVRNVGQGQLDLDQIVGKIEHGYKLIATMRSRLDATKSQVEKMRVDFERGESSPSDKDPSEKHSKKHAEKHTEKHANKPSKSIQSKDSEEEDSDDGDDDDMPF